MKLKSLHTALHEVTFIKIEVDLFISKNRVVWETRWLTFTAATVIEDNDLVNGLRNVSEVELHLQPNNGSAL